MHSRDAHQSDEETPIHKDESKQRERPEQVIVEVYRMLREARARGEQPERVIMDRETYDAIQAYRARLGDAPEGQPDYLEQYAIFGLEIFVEINAGLEVC
ncbi:MAG: hypothetical protein ACLFP4_13220 [Spirochaetales bacterium]